MMSGRIDTDKRAWIFSCFIASPYLKEKCRGNESRVHGFDKSEHALSPRSNFQCCCTCRIASPFDDTARNSSNEGSSATSSGLRPRSLSRSEGVSVRQAPSPIVRMLKEFDQEKLSSAICAVRYRSYRRHFSRIPYEASIVSFGICGRLVRWPYTPDTSHFASGIKLHWASSPPLLAVSLGPQWRKRFCAGRQLEGDRDSISYSSFLPTL